jgi:hypothetical protein
MDGWMVVGLLSPVELIIGYNLEPVLETLVGLPLLSFLEKRNDTACVC